MLRITTVIVALVLGFGVRTADAQDKITPAEAKAAAELKKGTIRVEVDASRPDKPVIGLGYYSRTIDEKMAALLMDMKHLKSLGGYDVKFKPGVLKLLKSHPTLETIGFAGTTDVAAVLELPEGPPIKELFMYDGKFTAAHFEAIAKVPSIRLVRVSLSRLKPDIVRPLHKLKHLESLSVYGDEPMSAADLAGFDSLTQLTCVEPNDSPEFFGAIAKMKSLHRLTLLPHFTGAKRKTPLGLEKLAALTNLIELTLHIPANDTVLKALAPMKNLAALNVEVLGVTAAGIKSLAALPKLAGLSLRAAGLPETAVVELKELRSLQQLRLNVGPLTDAGMAAICKLTTLEVLQLGEFKPGADKAMSHIVKLTKLRLLDLTFSDLSDTGLKELIPLKNLAEVKVGGTKTTAAGIAAFQKARPNVNVVTSFTTGGF